jgi:AcrR family transcriptional regulator
LLRDTKANRRKQPTQARATVTVEAILVASARIFRERGFERASVNAIAELAGVSVGSLYQYFPSKEALLVALAEHHTGESLALLEATLMEIADVPLPSGVRSVVSRMIEAHADPLHRVLAHGLDALGLATSIQATIDARAGAAVERFLRHRGAELRVRSFELSALIMVRTIDLITHAAIDRHPASIADGSLVDELTALALGYLLKPPPE